MTNTMLLDLMLKNGAVSFYTKKGKELTLETPYDQTCAYVVFQDYGSRDCKMVFAGDAVGLLAFLQEVCL